MPSSKPVFVLLSFIDAARLTVSAREVILVKLALQEDQQNHV